MSISHSADQYIALGGETMVVLVFCFGPVVGRANVLPPTKR